MQKKCKIYLVWEGLPKVTTYLNDEKEKGWGTSWRKQHSRQIQQQRPNHGEVLGEFWEQCGVDDKKEEWHGIKLQT